MLERIRNAIARTIDAISGRGAPAAPVDRGPTVGGVALDESERPAWSGWWRGAVAGTMALATAAATPSPAPGVYKALEPEVWTDWTVPGIRDALLEHERGQFRSTAILADYLLRDDRIFSTLQNRVKGALGLPHQTCASESTTNRKRAESLAAQVHAWWFRAIPESTHEELLRWFVLMGFAIAQVYWDTSSVTGEWRPRLKVIHPQFITYDWNVGAFFVEVAGEEVDGKVVSGPRRIQVTPGDGRWLLLASSGERPWMNGAVRPLALLMLVRFFCTRDWVRRSEVTGIGIRKAMVPNAADEKVVAKFLRQVQRLGAETTLRLPEGFNFAIEAVDGQATTLFESLTRRCDMGITLVLLGQNLTTQAGDTGNQGAAAIHASVKLDLLEADVEALSTVCREHVLLPWGRFNVANWNDDWAPWPYWDPTPPEDLKIAAETLNTLGDALPKLEAQGVDTDRVLERFDLKRRPDWMRKPPTDPTDANDPNETTEPQSEAA